MHKASSTKVLAFLISFPPALRSQNIMKKWNNVSYRAFKGCISITIVHLGTCEFFDFPVSVTESKLRVHSLDLPFNQSMHQSPYRQILDNLVKQAEEHSSFLPKSTVNWDQILLELMAWKYICALTKKSVNHLGPNLFCLLEIHQRNCRANSEPRSLQNCRQMVNSWM